MCHDHLTEWLIVNRPRTFRHQRSTGPYKYRLFAGDGMPESLGHDGTSVRAEVAQNAAHSWTRTVQFYVATSGTLKCGLLTFCRSHQIAQRCF
jgi:hypothetical protein